MHQIHNFNVKTLLGDGKRYLHENRKILCITAEYMKKTGRVDEL